MYVDLSDKEVGSFVECVTKIINSVGLNKNDQIELVKEYVKNILLNSFKKYNISCIQVVDKIMRSVYSADTVLPRASKSVIEAIYSDVCLGNSILNVSEFIEFVYCGVEGDGSDYSDIDKSYLDLGQTISIDRFDKTKIDDTDLAEFKILLKAVFELYCLSKEEWHSILEEWLTECCYDSLLKKSITDDEFQKVMKMAEECDDFTKSESTIEFDLKYIEFINSLLKSKSDILNFSSIHKFIESTVKNRIADPIPNGTKVLVDYVCDMENVESSVVGYYVDNDSRYLYIVKPLKNIGDYDCYLVSRGDLNIIK